MKQIPPDIQERIVYKSRKNADEESAAFPTLEKLEPVPLTCDGCDKVVVDRRTEIKQYSYPDIHWREYCQNCKMFKDPNTGQFTVKHNVAPSFFRFYVLTRNK